MIKILYVAHFYKGSTAYERLNDLKCNFDVEILNISLFFPIWKRSFSSIWRKLSFGPPFFNLYKALICILDKYPFEIVFIEKNLYINLFNLNYLKKKYGVKLVMFNHDSLKVKDNISRILINSLPVFDKVISTKKYDLNLYKKYGVYNIYFVKDAISTKTIESNLISENISSNFKYDIGFIGRWEIGREKLIKRLALELNFNFVVSGPGWLNKKNVFSNNVEILNSVWGDDYINLIKSIKINLGLLSEKAEDEFTTRIIEIPVYNGFMLTNFNPETLNIFSKNQAEGILYKNYDELLNKVYFFVRNNKARNNLLRRTKKSIFINKLTWKDQLNNLILDTK